MAGGSPSQADQSHDSFSTQIRSFGATYWIANWMELVERFAYYGVRTVLPVFMVLAVAEGGPEFDHVAKGTIFAVWAIVQSFLPILSGGFADRYGYKLNIAISTFLKIVGYLLMGYTVAISEWIAGMPLQEARAAGTDSAFAVFFSGAMFLAAGTAIFKPGVQGLIANQMPKNASSLGWGLFYQMVNIGGFIGPLLAGYLRVLDWEYVFLACAIGIALNFIPLFFFAEPSKDHLGPSEGPMRLLYKAMKGLLEPRLFFFTIAFAGFWLMFYQLFDILPNFIDDWVDSRAVADGLASIVPATWVPTVNGGNLTQEWLINFNALLISLFAFAMGYLTGKVHSLTAIVVGILTSAVGIYLLGVSMSGWVILGAIAIFSLGEMMASPTKMRYLAGIAPPGKEGLYMGYSNFTVGIGWSIGSVVAGRRYEEGGDKIELARKYLIEKSGLAEARVDGIERENVMGVFEQTLNVDAWGARQILWETYEPYTMWLLFCGIGLASMLAIIVYNVTVARADQRPSHPLNTHGNQIVQGFLIPLVGLFAYYSWDQWPETFAWADIPWGILLNGCFFATMLLVSFIHDDGAEPSASPAT